MSQSQGLLLREHIYRYKHENVPLTVKSELTNKLPLFSQLRTKHVPVSSQPIQIGMKTLAAYPLCNCQDETVEHHLHITEFRKHFFPNIPIFINVSMIPQNRCDLHYRCKLMFNCNLIGIQHRGKLSLVH